MKRNQRVSNHSIRKSNDIYSRLTKINDVNVIYNGAVAEYEDIADYYRRGSIKAVKLA